MASNLTNESKKHLKRFVSIWLDSKNDGPTNKNKFKRFKELGVEFVAVTTPEECGKTIIEQKKVRPLPSIIIIISGALSQQNIPKFQDEFCVIAFLIFCFEVENYQEIKYPKLRRISDDITEITKEINILINRTDDTDDFSIFLNPGSTNSNLPQCHFRNVERDQIRLIWLSKIHRFICAANDDENEMAKAEYVEKLLSRCEKDETEKNAVQQFSEESINQNVQNAIRWYTKDTIIYRDLNQACRTENIVEVYSHRYMIKLISRQLKIQNEKFVQKSGELKFYRGGCVEDDYIAQIKANEGKMIAINGFWSVSTKEQVAKKFINRRESEGLHKILFVIKIDMKKTHNSIFADVSKLSEFEPECEVIFDLGSIFTIDSVEFKEKESCYVVLLSASDESEQVVNEYIERTYVDDGIGVNQSILFGKFVFDMGEKKFALDYFLKIKSSLPKNDPNIWAIYYNNLGVCYDADKNPDKAKEYYWKALELNKELKNNRALGSIYHNLASIFLDENNYDEADEKAQKAYHLRQNNPSECASTLDLIGWIALAQIDHEKAENSFRQALKLRQQCFRSENNSHPDIGQSHEHLAIIYVIEKQHDEAIDHYRRALAIYEKNYPPMNPKIIKIVEHLKVLEKSV